MSPSRYCSRPATRTKIQPKKTQKKTQPLKTQAKHAQAKKVLQKALRKTQPKPMLKPKHKAKQNSSTAQARKQSLPRTQPLAHAQKGSCLDHERHMHINVPMYICRAKDCWRPACNAFGECKYHFDHRIEHDKLHLLHPHLHLIDSFIMICEEEHDEKAEEAEQHEQVQQAAIRHKLPHMPSITSRYRRHSSGRYCQESKWVRLTGMRMM